MFTYINAELKKLKEKNDMKIADVIAVRRNKKGENPFYREIESERKHTNFIRIIPASITLLIVDFCGMLWAVWSQIKFDYGKWFLVSSCIFLLISIVFISLIENGLKKPFLSDKFKKLTYEVYWVLYAVEAMSFSIMEYLDRGTINNFVAFVIIFTLLPIVEPLPKILIYFFTGGAQIHIMLFANKSTSLFDYGDAAICVALTVIGIIFSFVRFYFYISDAVTKKNFLYSANGDPLTGLMNRRGFEMSVPSLRGFCINNGYKLCVAMFDIDDFKSFNDTHGHIKGDVCIKSVADCIKKNFSRPTDLCVRYGGEEFLVVTAQRDMEKFVNHLCDAVKEVSETEIDGVKETVTVSAGLYSCEDDGKKDTERFVEKADEQLYMAKINGKNCLYYENEKYR